MEETISVSLSSTHPAGAPPHGTSGAPAGPMRGIALLFGGLGVLLPAIAVAVSLASPRMSVIHVAAAAVFAVGGLAMMRQAWGLWHGRKVVGAWTLGAALTAADMAGGGAGDGGGGDGGGGGD